MIDGLDKAQRAYDREEPTTRSVIDLADFQIERHIFEFATSEEDAKEFLICRGVSEDGLSYFADLLRVLAKDFVAGKGCSPEFWQIMSRHAHEIADETAQNEEAEDALASFFDGGVQRVFTLGIRR